MSMMLVGDTLGMVIHGLKPLGVTLEMMILHGRRMRGATRAGGGGHAVRQLRESPETAFRNASRIMKETGCQAVKPEGGTRLAQTIHYLSQRGIPVVGHIGMTPQNVQVLGGKTQGCTSRVAGAGSRCQGGGGCGCLRGRSGSHGRTAGGRITAQIAIPTIGIGASPACDGQF
jgi:3-methyl-2-oxobutanoate hydroxymethyltransferase